MQQQQQQKNKKYPLFFALLSSQMLVATYRQLCCPSMGTLCRNWNWHMWLVILQWRESQPPRSCQLKLANLISLPLSLSAWCLHRHDWSLHLVRTLFLSWATQTSCRAASISATATGERWDLEADTEAMEGLQVAGLFNLLLKRGNSIMLGLTLSPVSPSPQSDITSHYDTSL